MKIIVDTQDRFRGQRILLEVDLSTTPSGATQEKIDQDLKHWKYFLEKELKNTLQKGRDS